MDAQIALGTFGVFAGCCLSIIFLELIVRHDTGAGNLITCVQFLFVSAEGFVSRWATGALQRHVRMADYALLVVLFFLTNTLNNYAFHLSIPMPLHMIFRCGTLISNMLMGAVLLRRHYRLSQYLAVLLITVGIFLCTYVSASDELPMATTALVVDDNEHWWRALGIVVLAIALLLSSYMGICQERLYARYGKRDREVLFYTHLLPLPGFLLLRENITEHFHIAWKSAPIVVPLAFGLNFSVPVLLCHFSAYTITQYVCIRSVYKLTTECSSLTVTLILMLRKFISLIFTIIYFQNPFTLSHWLGTALVFGGTLWFTGVGGRSWQSQKLKTS